MLHLAGILCGGGGVYTDLLKELRDYGVALEYLFGMLSAGIGERNMTCGVNRDIAVAAQDTDGAAHARL